MPHFLVAVQLPHDFDSSKETAATARAIDELNQEMVAAGIRVFVGGLQAPGTARSMRVTDGKVQVTDGPYIEAKEYIGGFWVLEVASMEEAVKWGSKATVACGVPIEVRPFDGRG